MKIAMRLVAALLMIVAVLALAIGTVLAGLAGLLNSFDTPH